MKKIKYLTPLLLLSSIFFSYNQSYAQSVSKPDFDNLVINEFCDSFTKASAHITKDNMATELSVMIIPILGKYKEEFKSEWGFDMDKKDDFQKVGEKIGQLATLKCPAFFKFVKDNLNEIVADRSAAPSKFYVGKILKIEGQPFAYLQVQNSQGKSEKIYWLSYFEGANKLATQANLFLNKSVTISYKEIEVYQIADKEYKTIKVITKVQF